MVFQRSMFNIFNNSIMWATIRLKWRSQEKRLWGLDRWKGLDIKIKKIIYSLLTPLIVYNLLPVMPKIITLPNKNRYGEISLSWWLRTICTFIHVKICLIRSLVLKTLPLMFRMKQREICSGLFFGIWQVWHV